MPGLFCCPYPVFERALRRGCSAIAESSVALRYRPRFSGEKMDSVFLVLPDFLIILLGAVLAASPWFPAASCRVRTASYIGY